MDKSHKYLLEVFDKDHIPFPYSEEDYAAFDRRDTYNLDNYSHNPTRSLA